MAVLFYGVVREQIVFRGEFTSDDLTGRSEPSPAAWFLNAGYALSRKTLTFFRGGLLSAFDDFERKRVQKTRSIE